MPPGEQARDGQRIDRLAEVIALHFVALMLFEKTVLLGGFYAFRDHAQAQAVSHRDDGLRDRRVVLVARQIEHERAVDFYAAEREALQVTQRRVAGAEIVDRDPHAQTL